MLFDLMIALQSKVTHDITLKNLALFRPKIRDSYSTNQIARFVNVIEFSNRLINREKCRSKLFCITI